MALTVEQLIVRMTEAKMLIQQVQREAGGHSNRCAVELDPEGYAPCSCGASGRNSKIDEAIKKLSF